MGIIRRIKRIREIKNSIKELEKEIQPLLNELKSREYSHDDFDKVMYLSSLMNKQSNLYIERMNLLGL